MKDGPWVGTWAAAPQMTALADLPLLPDLADTTLRQVVRVSLGGTQIRVRFSNVFGAGPLTITAASVAVSAGRGEIRPETAEQLTFCGKASASIPPGESVNSDPTGFHLAPLSDLAVTIHVKEPSGTITGHPGAHSTTYLAAGKSVAAQALPGATVMEHWYYLRGVDVAAEPPAGAVAVLGDSLTDGRGSTTDGNTRWPDILARRLQRDTRTAHIAMLNAGIGGNRVCADGLGPSALARMDRDVLSQPGVRWLILLEGINDLGTCAAAAQDLIAAYEEMIYRAHGHGVHVFGGTLTPCGGSFYFSPEMEAARQAVNAWIRAAGHFDAVVDFDAATRDPQNLTHLRTDADCGDHLHLNDIGYKLMAEAIDLELFIDDRQER